MAAHVHLKNEFTEDGKCHNLMMHHLLSFVSGNLTDPTFLGPTLNYFGTSENFSSIFRVFWMIFMLSLCKKIFTKKKTNCLPTYIPTLKNIETFPETRHFFFWPYYFIFSSKQLQILSRILPSNFQYFTIIFSTWKTTTHKQLVVL